MRLFPDWQGPLVDDPEIEDDFEIARMFAEGEARGRGYDVGVDTVARR